MQSCVERFPLILNVVIVLEIKIGFGVFDALIFKHIHNGDDKRGDYSLAGVFGFYSDQREVDYFRMSHGFKYSYKRGWSKSSARRLNGFCP